MGETEEKGTAAATDPQQTEAEAEPKETDSMLKKEEEKPATEELKKSKENLVAAEPEEKKDEEEKKVNGDEIINIPDEEAKKDEEKKPEEAAEKETETKKDKKKKEDREVKPRKIPIGGFKLPGFFTRNKKPEESDGAEGGLLEKTEGDVEKGTPAAGEEEAEKAEEAAAPTESRFNRNILNYLRIRNPFAKKGSADLVPTEDVEAEKKDGEEAPKEPTENGDEKKEESEEKPEGEDVEKSKEEAKPADETAPAAEKKSLLSNIRLPHITLSNLIPKRLRPGQAATDDLEMGNGPNNKAGLASMETLDDSQKDNDSKDTTDKAVNGKTAEEDMETVKLDEKEEKPKDKAEEAAADQKPKPILDRIRTYQCSVDDLAITAGIAVFLLLVAIICIFTFTGKNELKAAPIKDGRFVEAVTTCGFVEGLYEESAFAFRGIPYAVPPVGEKRWRPAQVIDNIDNCWNGTFLAHNSTPVCLQTAANGTAIGIEDCLTLDVITPHVRYDNPLPVVVLIGAESVLGDSPSRLRPSKRYARARDVVFVRPNFRMGVLGFLALDELSKSSHPPRSGNYALSDILAALKWIQLNIANFGGDAKSVTLFGHRTGATLVTALTTSPLAKDLYARAWVTSGSALFPGQPLPEYEKKNKAYMAQSKCTTAECLRSSSTSDLLDAVPDTWGRTWPDLPAAEENATTGHDWLILDGEILFQHPADVWSSEEQGPTRLVIGTTMHESHSEKLNLKHKEWTAERVRQHIQESRIGQLNLTDEALKRYNATYQGLVSMISDIRTVCPLLTIARQQQNVPFYVVTQTGGNLTIADVDSDILAILGRYEPKTPEERRYVSAMQQLFYHYVSHGIVAQFEPRKPVLEIGQDALPVENIENCDFWIQSDIVPRYAKLD